MYSKRILCLILAVAGILTLSAGVLAAEVDCDSAYCFTDADFSTSEDTLTGICITGLPAPDTGTVMLGTRVLQKGDILTAGQVAQMTFHPLRTEEDASATVTYLPIYENRVETSASMTISIRGKEDLAPVAQDSAMETYKNLPNEGKLNVTDPEGQALRYTLVRQPKRGTVTLNEDGSFTYTPKKNKVGVDSFTFTATDPAGKVSREATVTIQILKPTDAKQYSDTAGHECRFAAEWLKNTGLFVGERVNGQFCFQPEKAVNQGEFIAMMVKALDIPTDKLDYTGLPENTPQWLRPYMAAALRSGLVSGLEENGLDAHADVTGAQAAVMLQNALDLSISGDALETVAAMEDTTPDWAVAAMTALQYNGIYLPANEPLTRGDLALALYQADYLSLTAPGLEVIRKQQ